MGESSYRERSHMNKILKWVGIVLGAVVAIVLVLVICTYVLSSRALGRRYAPTVPTVSIPTDSASLVRGEHLASAIAKCTDCHGEHLGGTMKISDPAFGHLAAPNLTRGRGGFGATLTNEDWVRAVRHGVAPDGRGLLLMPAEAYIHLDTADLAAIIAWARSVPPVDSQWPASQLGPVARALLATGKLPLIAAAYIDHSEMATAPPADTTVAYGRYLAQIGGCTACHNAALSGGPIAGAPPGTPPAANLTPGGIASYTEADFFRALREGKRPGDVAINDFMPWRFTRLMTDPEIRAVWKYLRSLPAKELGQQ
jgi:cytochrome c553